MKRYQAGEGIGVSSYAVGIAVSDKYQNILATIINAAKEKTCKQNTFDHLL